MKKNQVKIGEVYSVKVSGSMAPVRVDRENPRGGWDGTNMKTKKSVRIKSAQRLRGKAVWPPRASGKAEAAGEAKPPIADAKKAGKAGDKGKPAKAKQDGGKKAKRMTGLDAAAKVLADAGKPLGCKTIVERMLATGLWKTTGKTPAATIYAAIFREIAGRGSKSRFRKVDRGQFGLNA